WLRSLIFEMFASRLTEVMSLVEEVAFRRMDRRLARRLGELFGDSRGVIETTHADIAAGLGTARGGGGRLLQEVERLGSIRLSRGRIELRNQELLREIAAGEVR